MSKYSIGHYALNVKWAVFGLFLVCISGCADKPHLQPIPAPMLPQTISVPVLVAIPITMTTPCEEPRRRNIFTDVQLLEAADAWKVVARCNAAKLRAIADSQPK